MNTYTDVATFMMEFIVVGASVQLAMHFIGVAVGAPVRWIEDQFTKGSRG